MLLMYFSRIWKDYIDPSREIPLGICVLFYKITDLNILLFMMKYYVFYIRLC